MASVSNTSNAVQKISSMFTSNLFTFTIIFLFTRNWLEGKSRLFRISLIFTSLCTIPLAMCIQAVVVAIAAISLIVGAIGIMNTMYTAVLERTKEIGVMKAVGARNEDIIMIFLIESGSLGFIGGLIGIAIGLGAANIIAFIARQALGSNLFQVSVDPSILLGILAFSFVIGAFSGVLPALQASNLKPVDALRYE